MKLRNKKTGEIIDLDIADIKSQFDAISVIPEPAVLGTPVYVYTSLAELNEEWEDYKEEPKPYYYLDCDSEIQKTYYDECSFDKSCEKIGNRFESLKEAERAVEKLKAWKRLKDRGFRFDGYNACSVDYDIDEQYRRYISEDLDLLFGGKE